MAEFPFHRRRHGAPVPVAFPRQREVGFQVLLNEAVEDGLLGAAATVRDGARARCGQVLYSLAVTFFAFEGFRVITNCAEDMPEPHKTLPRAMLIAIGGVLVIYVAVALAVFGNLGVEQVVEAKDYALAEAARPVFGLAGFSVVAIAALVSTASSINANLYAVTNVTYQLAKEGELPAAFGQPIGRSREGLLISAGFIMLLGHAFDLSEIAAVGSITVLIVHLTVHLGHLRLLEETGASTTLVLTAIVLILVAIVFASLYALQTLPHVLWLVAGSLVAAAIMAILLHRLTGRRIQTRTPAQAGAYRHL